MKSEPNGKDRLVRRYTLYIGALAATIATAGLLWNSGNAIGALVYGLAQQANAKRFEELDQRMKVGAERDSLMMIEIRHLGSWAVQHANDTRAHRMNGAPP